MFVCVLGVLLFRAALLYFGMYFVLPFVIPVGTSVFRYFLFPFVR